MAVEGYRSFTVNMKPPRSSVMQLLHSNGDHAGYANCIRLYNGENALITAYHNGVDLVVTGKTGNKIPLSQFKELFAHPPTDIRILVGPPNWEGLLGCKGTYFVTADRVGKCAASFFNLHDGEWQSNSAQIVGSYEKFATVLSNTDFGDSGSGYFNGKTLLGVHKGHPENENFNLMAVIPPIVGITIPNYIYETTMPQGKIFSDEIIKIFKEVIPLHYKPVGGGLSWADQVEINETKPKKSGNEASSSDCQNNRNSNTHIEGGSGSTGSMQTAPSTPPTVNAAWPPVQNLAQEVIDNLCARINLSTLEAAVVEKLSSQALKKRNPRKRGKRGGKAVLNNTPNFSNQSTTGKYVPPNRRSRASALVGESHNTISPPQNVKRNGVGGSVGRIPTWVRKPQALGGPKMGPKPS